MTAPTDVHDIAIEVADVSKIYQMYSAPQHRLWQGLFRGRRCFYHEFHALRHVSFSVPRGQTVGIVGRNGSGKSTLLQIVCGTLAATTGRVQTGGRVAALLELGAGFNPEFTGRENVYLNAAIFGLSRTEIERRYDQIIEFADIGEFIDQPVKTYSSGMVVRLAFAVIAHLEADVLVIDEALAVGDAFFVQKCMRMLREFMTRGTILFVSHDTGAVLNLCQRALWLHKGELVMDGAPGDVVDAYLRELAEEAYVNAAHGTPALKREVFTSRGSSGQPIGLEGPDQGEGETASDGRPTAGTIVTMDRLRRERPRTVMEISGIDLTGRAFGKGGARIIEVSLLDSQERSVQIIEGGEQVTLKVSCEVYESLSSPIVGFGVKDRLGQVVFGDNTFLQYAHRPVTVGPGRRLEARFTFVMPALVVGEYTIGVAVADGTQLHHVQHHWVYEALCFQSTQTNVIRGLMGIPMLGIVLAVPAPASA